MFPSRRAELVNIETGTSDPKASTLAAIIAALEKEVAEFTKADQPGMRLRKAKADSEPTRAGSRGRRLQRNQARECQPALQPMRRGAGRPLDG